MILEPWNTPQGLKCVTVTEHFKERFRYRFIDVEVGDLSLHVTRCMLKSVVVSGMPGQREDDYYLWHEGTDYIMVMAGYMGAFVTIYRASESEWFTRSGAAAMKWPKCSEVFGEPAKGAHWATKTQSQQEKLEARAKKREEKYLEEQRKKYEQWYPDIKVDEGAG